MGKEFYGISAASGKAEGTARWVLSEVDLDSFQVGEIVFAKMTSPDWGNLFQKASAVVTEQGGMLCHAAVVAIGEELAEVQNGTKVIVDGDEGIVTIAD